MVIQNFDWTVIWDSRFWTIMENGFSYLKPVEIGWSEF